MESAQTATEKCRDFVDSKMSDAEKTDQNHNVSFEAEFEVNISDLQ